MNKFGILLVLLALTITLGSAVGSNEKLWAQTTNQPTPNADNTTAAIKGLTVDIRNMNPTDKGESAIGPLVEKASAIERSPDHYLTLNILDQTTGVTEVYTAQNLTAIDQRMRAEGSETADEGLAATFAFTIVDDKWGNFDVYVHNATAAG